MKNLSLLLLSFISISAFSQSALITPKATTLTAATVANSSVMSVSNTSTADSTVGIKGTTASLNLGIAVKGISTATTPSGPTIGLWGENTATNGTGIGVYGTCDYGFGVVAATINGTALRASAVNGVAGDFLSSTADALTSATYSLSGGAAINGQAKYTTPNVDNYGIYGANASTNNHGFGVYGGHAGTGVAILGVAASGIGMKGTSNIGTGVVGFSSSGIAGNFSSTNGYALITGTGKVGIGLNTVSTNEIMEVNGRMRLHRNTFASGLWLNNSANGTALTDGAFIGLNNETAGSETAGFWLNGAFRFLVDRAGNTTTSGEVNRTQTSTANVVPIAYGNITADGVLQTSSSTDNVSVSHSTTGVYSITIAGESFNNSNYTVVATLNDTYFGFITVSGIGSLNILTAGTGGSFTDHGFTFVVYKK